MYGGTIEGNTAGSSDQVEGHEQNDLNNDHDRGGVYVGSGAKFTMSGGKISKNTASQYGGGVYIEFEDLTNEGGIFTMSGGTNGIVCSSWRCNGGYCYTGCCGCRRYYTIGYRF